MRCWVWVVVLFAGTAWAQGKPALPRFRHDHVNVYPVASASFTPAITIDGDLSEWRPEAFVQMTQGPGEARANTVYMAFAYDDTGFYYALRALDPRPMLNFVDPAQDATDGWRGCSLQLRMVTDPAFTTANAWGAAYTKKTVHASIWQFTRKELPCLDLRYCMYFGDPETLTGDAAHLHYRRTLRGYTLEGMLPWKTLHAAPVAPGKRLLFTVQPHWADELGGEAVTFYDCLTREDNLQVPYQNITLWGSAIFVKSEDVAATFTAQADAEHRLFAPDPPSTQWLIPLKFMLPAAGNVSLGVYKPTGPLVRNVLACTPSPAGPQMAYWDGLDEDGKPVPAGPYALKMLTQGGITATPVTETGPGLPVETHTVPGMRGHTFTYTTVAGKRVAYDGEGGLARVDGDRLIPAAYVGVPPVGWPVTPPEGTPLEHCLIVWNDANGDGRVQVDEVHAAPRLYDDPFPSPLFPGGAILADRHLFQPDANLALPLPDDAPPLLPKFSPISAVGGWHDLASAGDGPGGFVLADRGLFRFNADGKILWHYGNVDDDDSPRPFGLLRRPRLVGAVSDPAQPGGAVLAVNSDGCTELIAGNGLYLGRLGDDPILGTGFSITGARAFRKVGDAYRLYTDTGVFAVTGLDTVHAADAGTLHVTPEQYQARLMARPAPPAPAPPLFLPRATPTLDGTGRGWDPTCAVHFGIGGAIAATLAYDADALYVTCTLPHAAWRNAGTDWHTPFLTGDAVAVRLSGVLNHGPRKEAFPYTIHVFLAPDGEAGCRGVAFFPLAPMEANGSPVHLQGTAHAYDLTAAHLPALRAHVTRTADGYTLEAALPWATLGVELPPADMPLRADLGVYVADAAGRRTCAYQPLAAPRPRAIATLDDALRETLPETEKGWGVVAVER